MSVTMESVFIAPVAQFLVYLKPDDADPKHFYIPPEEHVRQAIGFYIFCFVTIYASRWGKITTAKLSKPPPPLNLTEHLFRTVLTINFLAQLVYKTTRGWRVLTYMFQPCHAATLLYLYCLYTKDYSRATKAFQIGLHYMFFTALAIAVPDTAQLQLPLEVTNFWVQHWALLLCPLYLLVNGRFILSPSWALTSYAVGLGMLYHFVTQLPAALLSGVNVNYMLWPPPGVPPIATQTNYRIMLSLLFVPLAIFTGYYLPKIVLRLQRKPAAKPKQK